MLILGILRPCTQIWTGPFNDSCSKQEMEILERIIFQLLIHRMPLKFTG